jgi:hypothetical protein
VFDKWGRVLPHEEETLLYYSRWEDEGAEPYARIGVARSTDGLDFEDEGIVWGGSGELGIDGDSLEHELQDPVPWFDGTRVHLLFTTYADRLDIDVGYSVNSVGRAVSDDGVSFTAATWPFPATPCVDAPRGGSDWQSLSIAATVRSMCGECSDGLWLILRGHFCGGAEGMFLTHTADGERFDEPQPVELANAPGTLLIGAEQSLFVYGEYEERSEVMAARVDTPPELATCL